MPNGVVRFYFVRYTSGGTMDSETVEGALNFFSFENLKPFTDYNVTVWAETVQRGEPSSLVTVTTFQSSKLWIK